jgi:transcriptional regulator with XRE-family HTH domain
MNVVQDLRLRAGLTQALLAQLSGVSQKSISRYEVGSRSPTLDVLSRLAAAVDLAIEVNVVPNHGDDGPPPTTRSPVAPMPEPGVAPERPTRAPPGDLWTT